MQLYFRGIEVPALGSPRDKVFRDYLSHENRVEAKKHELLLLVALATPTFADANKQRTWGTETTKLFNAYASLLWGIEPKDVSDADREWTNYYEQVVKETEVRGFIDKDGKQKAMIRSKKRKKK